MKAQTAGEGGCLSRRGAAGADRRTCGMRRFFAGAVLAAALSCALGLCAPCLSPSLAHADILGSDLIGSTSVSDRNLTVSEVPTLDCTNGIL